MFKSSTMWLSSVVNVSTQFSLFQVDRHGGSIQDVNVTWLAVGEFVNELVETKGLVYFEENQVLSDLTIKIKGDTMPELAQVINIQLTEVSLVSL